MGEVWGERASPIALGGQASPSARNEHASLSARREPSSVLDALFQSALASSDIDAALALAAELGQTVPRPASGSTRALWESLATLAAADVSVARVAEPHLDALAILDECADEVGLDMIGAGPDSTWGVFAAEAPTARLTATESRGAWVLSGAKAWCSLAGRLSHALVTAEVGDGARRLFAVALTDPRVTVVSGAWAARGLSEIESGPVEFADVPAVPVGAPGWYLERAGFAWGGIGVAAVWWGAALGIARKLRDQARSRDPDQVALMHLGAVDVALETARLALVSGADVVDRGGASSRSDAGLLALRTRTIVADAAEDVILRVGHALGPAPLALDARHAARVADLSLYLRQHHAERDQAALGRRLLAGGSAW